MLDKKRLSLLEDAVELHHTGLLEDLRLRFSSLVAPASPEPA